MATAQVTNPAPEHHLTRKPVPSISGETLSVGRLLELALSKDVSVERGQQMMDMLLRWEANEARKAFVVAMNEFKKNPPDVVKSATANTGSYSYSYATLDSVCRAVIQGLSAVGISHRWEMVQNAGANGTIEITCILTHDLGHSEETSLQAQPDNSGGKNSIQAIGSTVTYLQRYTLLAATGLAAAGQDNDGRTPATQTTNTKAIKQERRETMLTNIRRATTLDGLLREFKAAFTEAFDACDKNAQDAYIAAKDGRRKELAHGNR